MSTWTGQVREPAHTHTPRTQGSLACAHGHGARTHGQTCPQHSYSYLQGRVNTLFIGHIDTCIHALIIAHAYGILCVPTGTARTGPLVLGPQIGPGPNSLAFVPKQ